MNDSDSVKSKRMSKYARFIIRWRYAVLGIGAAITLAALAALRGLSIDTSLMALLPEDTPSIQRIRNIEKKMGGFGDLIIMLESVDTTTNLAFTKKILPQIEKLSWVDQVSYGMDDSFFRKNRLLYVDVHDLEAIRDRVLRFLSKKEQAVNPFLVDLSESADDGKLDFSDIEKKYGGGSAVRHLNVNSDGTLLLIVIKPKGNTGNISFARSMYGDLEEIVGRARDTREKNGVTIRLGGTYRNRIDEYVTVVNNVRSSLLAGAVIIILLLLIYFRSLRSVGILLVPLVMSILWTFGMVAVTIGALNLITAFLVIVLFGLGIDFGIHLLSRYNGFLAEGRTHEESLSGALLYAGGSSRSAALTTVAAFSMLVFSKFLGFRHFGIIAGMGVALAYIAYMTMLPALLSLGRSRQTGYAPHRPAADRGVISGHRERRRHFRGNGRAVAVAILTGCGIITLILLVSIRQIRFENDFRNLRARLPQTREFNRKVETVFTNARDPAVISVENGEETGMVLKYLRENGLMDTLSPVKEVRSMFTVVPPDQEKKLAILQEIHDALDRYYPSLGEHQKMQVDSMKNLLVAAPVSEAAVPPNILRFFRTRDGSPGQFVYLYQRKSLMDLKNAEEFSAAVGTIKTGGRTFHAVSEPLVYVDLVRLVERDSVIAVAAAFMLIFLIVFITTRRFWPTALIVSALLTGMVWVIGCMGLLHVRITLFNLVIFPSIVGLAVDSAIHLYHRLEEARKGKNGMFTALIETGGATILSTLTTLVGFGSFFFGRSPHPGLQSLAITAIIGMSACLLASLLYLPSMYYLFTEKKDK